MCHSLLRLHYGYYIRLIFEEYYIPVFNSYSTKIAFPVHFLWHERFKIYIKNLQTSIVFHQFNN